MPNSNKKGERRERELVNRLDQAGFAVMRAPASGAATTRELPDVLAGNGQVFYAIEAKASAGDPIYLQSGEIHDLVEVFARNFGAHPRVGVRFDREDWYFHHPRDLHQTPGGNYRVKKETALQSGETIQDLQTVEPSFPMRETRAYRSGGRKLSAFPWPGGKTHYVGKILPYFPEHRRYIEPFGGSAAVLLNKPPSYVEVFNDLDDDVVHFFRTVREQREDLQEWLRTVPYSESLHADWQDDYFEGHRPDDAVERAGQWFFLRCTTYGGSAGRRAGFKRPGKRSEPRSMRGNVSNLDAIVDRFQEVTISKEGYRTILDRYDHKETLFYVDPPYVDAGERYYPAADGFDFAAFVDALRDREGYWIVSSGDLPDGLEDVAVTTREFTARYSLPNATQKARVEATEHLSMNFDPERVEPWRHGGYQYGLDEFTGGARA